MRCSSAMAPTASPAATRSFAGRVGQGRRPLPLRHRRPAARAGGEGLRCRRRRRTARLQDAPLDRRLAGQERPRRRPASRTARSSAAVALASERMLSDMNARRLAGMRRDRSTRRSTSACLAGRLYLPARFARHGRRTGACIPAVVQLRPIRQGRGVAGLRGMVGRNFPAIRVRGRPVLSRSYEAGALAGVAQCWTGAFLKDLAVRPDMRRHGLGRALLHHCFAVFRRRGAPAVDLKVEAENLPLSASTKAPACTASRLPADRPGRARCEPASPTPPCKARDAPRPGSRTSAGAPRGRRSAPSPSVRRRRCGG